MIVGSVGFVVVDHQHINGTSFRIFCCGPGAPCRLRVGGHRHPAEHAVDPEHAAGSRRTCGKPGPFLTDASPIIHIHPRSAPTLSASTSRSRRTPTTPAPRDAPSFDIAGEERLLQEIVDEALAQGVWTTRARRLRGQELVEACPARHYGGAAAKGVRARRWRHHGRRREVLTKRKRLRLLPTADPEISRHTFALFLPS
ncbi:hypothetical protein EDB83DRAFT_462115, partial [Lactarius deliciosus]